MNISMNEVHTAKKISALKCLDSPVTIQVLNDMIRKYIKATGAPDKDYEYDVSLSNYTPGRASISICISGDKCYDWLMDQSSTAISGEIKSIITKTMIFASHNWTEVAMTFYVSCELPKEDFETLDSLGKVHRQYVSGHMQESIFCEVPSCEVPF